MCYANIAPSKCMYFINIPSTEHLSFCLIYVIISPLFMKKSCNIWSARWHVLRELIHARTYCEFVALTMSGSPTEKGFENS